ncbi:MAG: hypothetical protein FWE68_05805 [Defluviitaleaceae bacterium]|nr:hypothetical protein [Defluviitaleaceae bacterium]
MKKERIKILEMLEEGKISVDDATKLLEALKSGSAFPWDAPDYDDAEEKLNEFSKNVDQFAKDCSEKFSSVYKEVEPKLKSATKVVLEKTVSLLDDVSRSLNEAACNMENKGDCCCEGDECKEEDKPGEN